MRKTLLLSLALSLPLPAAAAPPRPSPPAPSQRTTAELEAQVRTILDGYEPRGVQQSLSQLGAPAADVLLRLINDPATRGVLRLRAVEALGYVPTPAGQSYLRDLVAQLAAAEDGRVFTLAAALRALGGFGPGELTRMSGFLSHSSADVREAAAAGLTAMRSDAVLPALQQRLAVEKDSGVRASLNLAIRRAGAAR